MTFTIGRASLPTDPNSVSWSGDQVTISGYIRPTTALDTDQANALRQQILGMVDNADEDIFPITSSTDSQIDGFYKCTSATIDEQPAISGRGIYPYTMTFVRTPNGYGKPLFETIVQTVPRNTSLSATPAGIISPYYTPTAYTYFDIDVSALGATGTSAITTEDGTLTSGTKAAPLTVNSWRHFVKPADFYKATAKVEIKYGSTWYPIHGLQIPAAVGANWRISNGYCRAYPSATGTSAKGITVETYRTGSWVGCEFAKFSYNTGLASWGAAFGMTGDTTGYVDPVILSNRPELVVVRIPLGSTSFTFSLRNGDTWIEMIDAYTSSAGSFTGLGRTTNTASTGFTGGVRATANDANGLRYLISCLDTGITDTTNGRYSSGTTTRQAVWQMTADYQAGYTGTDTVCRDLFQSARSDRRMVVAR
jgi:hypothetical protein